MPIVLETHPNKNTPMKVIWEQELKFEFSRHIKRFKRKFMNCLSLNFRAKMKGFESLREKVEVFEFSRQIYQFLEKRCSLNFPA